MAEAFARDNPKFNADCAKLFYALLKLHHKHFVVSSNRTVYIEGKCLKRARLDQMIVSCMSSDTVVPYEKKLLSLCRDNWNTLLSNLSPEIALVLCVKIFMQAGDNGGSDLPFFTHE